MVRIFNILSNNDLGGLEQSYINISKGLIEQGNNVICLMNKSAKVFDQATELTKTVGLNFLSKKNSYANPFAVIAFRKVIKLGKPDVIICHNGKIVKFLRKVVGESSHVKIIAFNHGTKLHRLEPADAIFHVNTADKIRAEAELPNLYHALIPNMIELESIEPTYKPIPELIVIGSLARFTEEKDHDFLVDCLKKLKERNVNYKAIIAGDGEMRQAVEKKILELGIREDCYLVGWLDAEQKKTFYQSIDIFFLHSKSESFGITILEAMSYGRLVIATDCDGPNDIFKDGLEELLIPKSDIKKAVDLIEKIIKNKTDFQDIPKQYKENLEKYSFKNVSTLIQSEIQNVIK